MEEIRTFKRYNFVTGAVDGTLAYDFGSPAVQQPLPEPERRPRRRSSEPTHPEWIREDEQEQTHQEEVRHARRVHPMGILCSLGAVVTAVLLVMTLFAQIRLVTISKETVEIEAVIETKQAVNDRLRVEYESVFNLKDVEEYATNVLGMQEPCEDQIYYLTNVSSSDRAVVVEDSDDNIFAQGMQDLTSAIDGFIGKILNRD